MSQKINPREVLSYLNELGYVNITAQQLKEFIKDLKKLIKYECRHEEIPTKISTPNFTGNYQNDDINKSDCHEKRSNTNDVFQALHEHNTVASRARTESSRGKQISVHITKTRTLKKLHDHCIHVDKNYVRNEESQVEPVPHKSDENRTILPNGNTETEVFNIKNSRPSSKESMIEPSSKESIIRPSSKESMTRPNSKDSVIRPNSKESLSSAPVKFKKTRSSVIKLGSIKSINRCDPVALYHQYNEEWKKIKFPGQDHHSDLRWAVREKLLAGPSVQIPLRKSSSKRKI